MNFTDAQKQEIADLIRPLQEWLLANCHPHVVVIVDNGNAEVMEGITTVQRVPRV